MSEFRSSPYRLVGAQTVSGSISVASDGDAATTDALFIKSEITTPSTPADGDGGVLYVKSDGKLYWLSNDVSETDLTSGGGGGLSAVVDDTAPQLGGTLDVNGQAISGSVVQISGSSITNIPTSEGAGFTINLPADGGSNTGFQCTVPGGAGHLKFGRQASGIYTGGTAFQASAGNCSFSLQGNQVLLQSYSPDIVINLNASTVDFKVTNQSDGNIFSIREDGHTELTGSLYVSGSLYGDGSGLDNITASPVGPDTSIQFSSGSAFSGSSNLTLVDDSDLRMTGSLSLEVGNTTGTKFNIRSKTGPNNLDFYKFTFTEGSSVYSNHVHSFKGDIIATGSLNLRTQPGYTNTTQHNIYGRTFIDAAQDGGPGGEITLKVGSTNWQTANIHLSGAVMCNNAMIVERGFVQKKGTVQGTSAGGQQYLEIDFRQGHWQETTLTNNKAGIALDTNEFVPSGFVGEFTWVLRQDSTGGRTVDFTNPSTSLPTGITTLNLYWPGGVGPTLSTSGSAVDIIKLNVHRDGTTVNVYGFVMGYDVK